MEVKSPIELSLLLPFLNLKITHIGPENWQKETQDTDPLTIAQKVQRSHFHKKG